MISSCYPALFMRDVLGLEMSCSVKYVKMKLDVGQGQQYRVVGRGFPGRNSVVGTVFLVLEESTRKTSSQMSCR
jgi:hypothetical protein